MKLNLEQTQAVTQGAVRVENREDGVHFYRFTQEQMDFYRETPGYGGPTPGFHGSTFATAGVKFRFFTDSFTLDMHICVKKLTTRSYFSMDVYADGSLVGELRNYDERRLPFVYVSHPLPTGDFFGRIRLGNTKKEREVCIHLPMCAETVVKEISLDDGASFRTTPGQKKLLCFGDSVTQGWDALRPSRCYTSRLAEYLHLEEVNKGIAGARFEGGLSALKDPFDPALITVAYGTNDWRLRTKEVFEKNCRQFFENLRASYPETPILALTPLWRDGAEREYMCGPFRGIDQSIRRLTSDLTNITVLDGYDVIPHSVDYLADRDVHPNHAGFDRCFEALKAYLDANGK